MRHLFKSMTALAALVTLCAAAPSFAGDMVPYKSRTVFTNVGTVTDPNHPDFGATISEATGQSTHLGNFSGMQWTKRTGFQDVPVSGGVVRIIFLSGHGYATAANGKAGYSWTFNGAIEIPWNQSTNLPALPPPYRIYADATHTGGWGRFEGATGGHYFEGMSNGGSATTGIVVGQSAGEISSVGANKKK